MNKKIFNKHGSVTTNLARDIMSLDIGDRLPTIIEYTEKFSVSRGIIQNSISLLEDEGCISLSRSGKLGTVLGKIDYGKLCKYTQWDPLVGAMPIPFNDLFRSLASAFYYEGQKLPIDSWVAYVSGAANRRAMLSKGVFDYIVTSVATAGYITSSDDDIELLFTLPDCRYEDPYCLIFMDNKDTEIRDGMKVGVDPEAIDQMQISKAMCKGKNVEFVKMPLEGIVEMLHNRSVDCMVIRKDKWLEDNTNMNPLPVAVTDYSIEETTIPAILVNKNNYGIKNLLSKFFSPADLASAQQKALNVQSNYRF